MKPYQQSQFRKKEEELLAKEEQRMFTIVGSCFAVILITAFCF